MSQQINLYDPNLLRKRQLLTAANLAVTALLLAAVVGGWGMWERSKLAAVEAENQVIAPQVKGLREQMETLAKKLAGIKPDPRLAAELAAMQDVLSLRADMINALKQGMGSESSSFAEYLRGLARQSLSGLWLTGFVVGEGSAGMEIRGRMTDPARLPEYIRRLNSEKAFNGREFSALKVSPGQPGEGAAPEKVVKAAGGAAASVAAVPYHEFTLLPVQETSVKTAPEVAETAPKSEPTALADILPADAGRALRDAGTAQAAEGKR